MLQASRLVAKVNTAGSKNARTVYVNTCVSQAPDPSRRPTALRQIYQKHDLARKANIDPPKNT